MMSMYFAFNVKLYTLNSAPQFLFFLLVVGGGGDLLDGVHLFLICSWVSFQGENIVWRSELIYEYLQLWSESFLGAFEIFKSDKLHINSFWKFITWSYSKYIIYFLLCYSSNVIFCNVVLLNIIILIVSSSHSTDAKLLI